MYYILLPDFFFIEDKVIDFCMGPSFNQFLKIADLLSGFIFYLNLFELEVHVEVPLDLTLFRTCCSLSKNEQNTIYKKSRKHLFKKLNHSESSSIQKY